MNIIKANSKDTRKKFTELKQTPEVFFKKGALKNSEKFTGKHLCQSLFLIEL